MSNKVVIITALPLEYKAVKSFVKDCQEVVHRSGTIYEEGEFQHWKIGLAEIGQGDSKAAVETGKAIQFFNPDYVFFVGVAGGIKDVNLGDVVIAEVVKGYEKGKETDTGFLPRGEMGQSSYPLIQRAKADAKNTDWFEKLNTNLKPKALVGVIAAGEKVVASEYSITYKRLVTLYSDALAVEMEGIGFLTAIHASNAKGIVIRGISDLLSNKTESDNSGWQEKAAHHAAAFAFAMLEKLGSTSDKEENLYLLKPPTIFNVPVPRNPFFTGRGDILAKLHEALKNENEIAITPSKKATALSGLGGVGKTQTVAEYAHRYQADYSAVLWVLADGKDLLRSSFAQLSVLLGFKAEKQDDQILAVQSWLRNNDGWLLIFDNAETLELLTAAKELLPTNAQGHVLFTTRAQATGGLASVTVDCFDDDTGAVFLLRRSKQVAMDLATLEQVRPRVSDKDWQTATELVHELGGLALAIDQAGAYIEQTDCGLEGYLSRYRTNAAVMLQERGGYVHSADHPEAVYKTFLLAAENAKSRSELAYEILLDSALLHPDGISEKLYADCNPLELDKALAALKDYSLIQRVQVEDRKFFTVHRLVQVVIRDVCDG
jgi:nucleoside phosphorylase